jgi:PucR C-terminal helix-turn-helix domain/GGDEF-like domain
MNDDLQRLVDSLANRLGRSLVLEDRQQRMVVYSQHREPMDEVRRESILRRETTPEVIGWFRKMGIHEATEPTRMPGNEDLHMLPRVCIPIRHRGLLLGFLWFIDPDDSMTDAEIQTAVTVGHDFALALYRENLSRELARQRENEALRNLLITEPAARAHAARELIDSGHFAQSEAVVAMVAMPIRTSGVEPDESLRSAIEQGLTGVRRQLGPRESLHLVRFDHGLLIVLSKPHTGVASPDSAEELLRSMTSAAGKENGVERIVVGVGSTAPRLEGIKESYEQALLAAQVASQLPSAGPVANWDELGVYRALVQLSKDEIGGAPLHPGLNRLLVGEANAPLVETLETYLDSAGNAQKTAEQLFLHRTTLYYRLKRISELTDADLHDGNDRLALHLGLKLARLTGRL